METLTIELTGNSALKAVKELEQKQLIRIVKNTDSDLYALPGVAMSDDDFKKWVENAENFPTISLQEAKQRWTTQKKKLQKHIR